MSENPVVFISYSHKDEAWKDLLKPHLKLLEQVGHITIWDDRQIDAGAEWYDEIKQALTNASIAVCLISADFLASDFCVKEEVPALLERRKKEGMVLIPFLIRPCAWQAVNWIKPIQILPRDGKSVAKDFKDDFDTAFTEVADAIFNLVSEPSYQPPVYLNEHKALPAEYVFIDHLPVTGSELFGRKKEMDLLDDAWNSGKFNIVSFVAWGGVGKSSLVNKWLESMKSDNYRGAKRVFGWTFYSQGTNEKADSADMFIAEALRWFGDPNPTEGSPWNKGRRLADLVCNCKTLFILDGLEPLQSHYEIEKGKIKDPALSVFIQELGKENPGLLLITTRENIYELNQLNDFVLQQNLDHISPESGRSLLRIAGVRGTDRELEDASLSFGNNALAIRLLGSYLYGEEGHRVSHISNIPDLAEIAVDEGKHPRRVMNAFAFRFGERAEVNYLRMLGLFDRPAEQEALESILRKKTISNLTKSIRKLGKEGQIKLLSDLRDSNLIARQGRHDKDNIDTHPMIRGHFGDQLKTMYPATWKEANGRLYEYYKSKAPDAINTIEDMRPLFYAVSHGCAAGRYSDAFNQIYIKKIRGIESLITKKLGAFSSDLSCIAHFFEKLWDEPTTILSKQDRVIILRFASLGLRALGRFNDAIRTMIAGLNISLSLKDKTLASLSSKDLSEYYLTMGNIGHAIEYAKHSVKLYGNEPVGHIRPYMIATLAHALHQSGGLEEASAYFVEAEEVQRKWDSNCHFLYSVRGFRYCDLLLDKGQYDEVVDRVKETLAVASTNQWVLEIALDQLSLARANFLKLQSTGGNSQTNIEDLFDHAVDGLRKSGYQDELPRGLLSRAVFHRINMAITKAHLDLDEALVISSRAGMKLYEADCHLEYSYLYFIEDKKDKMLEHFTKAKLMINNLSYGRRNKELKELEHLINIKSAPNSQVRARSREHF